MRITWEDQDITGARESGRQDQNVWAGDQRTTITIGGSDVTASGNHGTTPSTMPGPPISRPRIRAKPSHSMGSGTGPGFPGQSQRRPSVRGSRRKAEVPQDKRVPIWGAMAYGFSTGSLREASVYIPGQDSGGGSEALSSLVPAKQIASGVSQAQGHGVACTAARGS